MGPHGSRRRKAPPHHKVEKLIRDCKVERFAMNFDDTPQEAAFRAEARKWVNANAPKQYEAELTKPRSVGSVCRKKKSSTSARPGRRRRPKAVGPVCTGRRNMAGAARRRSSV